MGVFSGFANSVLTMTASGKHIIANAGIAIAGKIFGKAGFERFDSLPTELAHPANVYQLSDCIKAEVASMCCGDPSFEGIYDIRSDADFYAQTLNMANGIPSAERTRQRLDQCVQTEESFRKFHNAAALYSRDMIRGDIPADAGAFWYHHDDRISGPGGAPLAGIPPKSSRGMMSRVEGKVCWQTAEIGLTCVR